MRTAGPLASLKKRQDVVSVDLLLRQRGTRDRRERGENIDCAGQFPADRTGRDSTRPPHHRRLTHASLELLKLVTTQRQRRAADATVLVALDLVGGIALEVPRTVVGGVDHQGVPIQFQLLQRAHDLPHRPVHLLDRVPVQAGGRLARELGRGVQRDVRHRVRQVDKERPVLVGRDEADRLLGVPPGQRVLIDGELDDPCPAKQRRSGPAVVRRQLPKLLLGEPVSPEDVGGELHGRVGAHVVGIRDAEIGVETLVGRQELLLVTQVPLADAGGGVAACLEQLGDGHLAGVQPDLVPRKQHPEAADAFRVTAGHQCRPAGRADRRRRVEVGESHPLPSHPVDVWCLDVGRAKDTQVLVALVVGKDQDHVGCRLRAFRGRGVLAVSQGQLAKRDQLPVPLGCQLLGPVGVPGGKVSGFGAILAEVKQRGLLALGHDEFPVALADRTMAVVQPPQRVSLNGDILAQCRHQALARCRRCIGG